MEASVRLFADRPATDGRRRNHRQRASVSAQVCYRGYQASPDDEASLRRLVSFLDDLGDRLGALAAYDTFVRRLRDDGEMEPAPETIAVARAIRARTTRSPEFVAPADALAAPIVDTKPAPPAQRGLLSRGNAWLAGIVALLTVIGVTIVTGTAEYEVASRGSYTPYDLAGKAPTPNATNEYFRADTGGKAGGCSSRSAFHAGARCRSDFRGAYAGMGETKCSRFGTSGTGGGLPSTRRRSTGARSRPGVGRAARDARVRAHVLRLGLEGSGTRV